MSKIPRIFMKKNRFFRTMIFMLVMMMMSMALSGCFLWPVQEEMPKPPLVQPAEVSLPLTYAVRGPIEESIRGSAYYQPTITEAVALDNQSGKVLKVYMREGDLVNRGDLMLELDAGNLEDQLYMARINHERAQIAYDRLKDRAEIEGGGLKYDLRLAEINLEIETKRLSELETRYEQTRVYAPLSGVYSYVRRLRPEDTVSEGLVIAHISDPHSGALEYVNATNAHMFRMGDKVEVTFTKGGESFEYEVPVIGTPRMQPDDTNKPNTVTLDASDIPNLDFGDRVAIKLVLKRNEEAILVPRSVIREFQNDTFVYVLEEGMRTQRLVEVGITTSTMAEIVEGLEVGEEIFLR